MSLHEIHWYMHVPVGYACTCGYTCHRFSDHAPAGNEISSVRWVKMRFLYVFMYVYMYVCIYIYMYVCMYIYICMYVYICMCVYVCMYVCMYVPVEYACMYATKASDNVCMCVHVRRYVPLCIRTP